MSGKEKTIEIQPELIQNIHWSIARTYVLSTAVELDLFSFIDAGHNSVEKLTKALGSSLRAVRIFCDALVGMGLLGKTRGNYKLSPEAKTFLVRGESHYLGNYLLGNEGLERRYTHLSEVVKSGRPIEGIDDLKERKKFFKDLAKRIFPTSFASAVILSKKLGAGKTLKDMRILDIGCGSAAWSLALALADNSSRVVGIDFPEVIEVAKNTVKKFRATKQYEFREGDFNELAFEPKGYNVVILGHICHAQGEAGTRRLLKKSFEALKPGGKLLVAEYLANDLRTGPELPLLFALNMLLFTKYGDVFNTKELKRWMNLVGFKKVSALAVQYPCTVLVGTK